jgi:AAA15 family ATPase/GTPase
MVASPAAERTGLGRVAQTHFTTAPLILREACLFGANGSGKSSLIDAMSFMVRFIRNSFRHEPGRPIAVEPFAFHSEWRSQPSEFEAIFIHDDVLYQYGFSATCERVMEEWLFARPQETGRDRQLFTRTYVSETNSYEWNLNSAHLKGERESWKSQTRPGALFLSTAVQLNAEVLKGAYEWFAKRFRMFSMSPDAMQGGYTERRFEDTEWKKRVVDFLRRADISLHDIEVEENSLFEQPNFEKLPAPFQEMIKEEAPDAKTFAVSFIRQDEKANLIPLPLNEESSGTKALFELAGPILDVLDNGYTVVIDELNSGLHPLAFQYVIGLFCDPHINRNNAQLIFTTHDTSVTEQSCIGRDQIWLVDKGADLSARLIPFSDFKTRDERPFQKGYLQGRYGAVPRIVS